ncbi:MAG TPA: SH3 domain-containing protein [Thermoflexales bacterium]|nr:SH3 domain-containing protein [Thermoflexales bacterium]
MKRLNTLSFDARALASALACALALSGCGGGTPAPTQIKIELPANGAKAEIGKALTIKGSASGAAITRVEVWVDGAKLADVVAPDAAKGAPQIPLDGIAWTPMSDGSHIILLRAFGLDNAVLGSSDPVMVTSTGAPSPTPAPQIAPTAAPTVAPTAAAPTAAPTSLTASVVITNEFANIRSGPDTRYSMLGQLNKDATAIVKGRSADEKWFQILFDKSPNGLGWVFAELVQANDAAVKAPVVVAPPLPTLPPPPTLAPTAVITATPVAAVSPTPNQAECNPSSPTWRGKDTDSHGEYKFCVIEDLRFIEGSSGDYTRGTNKTLIAAWHLAGVDQIQLRIDGQAGCGGNAGGGARQVDVTPKGTYQFNINELAAGNWKVGLFVKNQYITNWLAYGEMYLCIK